MHDEPEVGGVMLSSFVRLAAWLVVIAIAAIACRQGDPAIDPKTPPNSPLPTKLDRPDDRPPSQGLPPLMSDGGGAKAH